MVSTPDRGPRTAFVRLASAAACLALLLGGCRHQGPRTVPCDRFDYAKTIGESSRTETLLSIVQLRYAELPTFLDVQQVVAGYNYEHTASGGVTINPQLNQNGDTETRLGYTGRFVERPTITYAPRTGAAFTRTMLTPIRPAILLSLIEMGWPADVLFRIAVNEINGVPNEGAAGWKDGQAPDFERVVQLIRGAQTAGLIDVNPSTLKEGVKKVKVSFREQKHTEEELKKLASIRELLGLEHAPGGYEVVYGARSESPNVIALQTRSLLQVLIALATEVEVPPSHVKRGFTQSFMTAENAGAPRIVRIQSGLHPPGPTAVKVQYRNTSFWIDDADFESKRVFAFVELLMQLTETTENDGPALVISTG